MKTASVSAQSSNQSIWTRFLLVAEDDDQQDEAQEPDRGEEQQRRTAGRGRTGRSAGGRRLSPVISADAVDRAVDALLVDVVVGEPAERRPGAAPERR